ncbi:MAG: signal peptidase I [Oscillospiraceae bacterium]|nr:signal peptidase I [Oscillospiraceae bacterium]
MKKSFAITGRIIVGLIIVVMAVFIFLTLSQRDAGMPNIFGYSVLTVETDSMKGDAKDNFQAGDLIIVKNLSPEQTLTLTTGQIITFWDIIDGQRAFNTHRITQVHNDSGIPSFTTKGDNNSVVDTDRKIANDVIGLYSGTKIVGGGTVMTFLQSKWGFFYCLVIPLLLFFLWQIYKLTKAIGAYRRLAIVEGEVKPVATPTTPVEVAPPPVAAEPEEVATVENSE